MTCAPCACYVPRQSQGNADRHGPTERPDSGMVRSSPEAPKIDTDPLSQE